MTSPVTFPGRCARFAALVLVAAAAVPATAGAAFPGENGPVAFDRDRAILSVPATGGAETPISQPVSDYDASYSPDGRRIVFEQLYDIYVMNADGTGRKALTTGGTNGDPSWSPDGKRVVYSSQANGNYELFSVAATGGSPQQITHSPGDDHNPVYSPDGTKLAYDHIGCQNSGGGTCVLVANADGTQEVNVTSEPTVPGCELQPGYYLNGASSQPDWSPDGKKVIFTGPVTCSVSSIGKDIWIMDADGRNKVDLNRDNATTDNHPVFSPDGKRIAFISDRAQDGHYHVYSMSATDGSDVQQLTTTATSGDNNPTWAVAATARCVVPNLKGRSRAAAKSALAKADCALGKVTRKAAKKGKRGRVIAQGRKAGKSYAAGTTVAITLRK
jgi:Tol biopolymer transport system component